MTNWGGSDKTIISLASLIELHNIGFKLIPLAEDVKTPTVNSTNEIFSNPNYWTAQKIEQEYYRFKNVATTYGKTHVKDEQGRELYLNELDIDSEEAFSRLAIIHVKGKDYFFIDDMCKTTYVVKTRKKYGRRIYWLSHEQPPSIRTADCKPGYEFEIKTDNTSGHGTLPPSNHRDDLTFYYQSIGGNKIAIEDRLYDGILKVLGDCLKPRERFYTNSKAIPEQENTDRLTDHDIQTIYDLLKPYYNKGYRHAICYALSGFLHKNAVHIDSAISIIKLLAKEDDEIGNRLANLSATYEKDRREVSGFYTLFEYPPKR
ncbi:hypothetical protein BH18THE2_BH18THE2_37200 [soil metagenome]